MSVGAPSPAPPLRPVEAPKAAPAPRRAWALTLPNQLSILRLGLAPLFVLFAMQGEYGAALGVFLAAGLTDALDGFIARVWRQQSTLGAYLDPVADKVLLASAVVCLAVLPSANPLPAWAAVLFVGRDLVLLVCVLVVLLATARREFRPSIFGKLTTFSQIVLVLYALAFNRLEQQAPYFEAVLGAAVLFTALSSLQYTRRMLAIFAEDQPPAERGGASPPR